MLESNRLDLGLVTGIAGITRVEIILTGAADHAGSTLMQYRRDASLAAAEIVLLVNREAHAFAARKQGHFVATTGILEISPNAANVVPGGARMIFDIRAERPALIDEFVALLDRESLAIAERTKVDRERFASCRRTRHRPATIICATFWDAARRSLAIRRRTLRRAPATTPPSCRTSGQARCCSFPAVAARATRPEEWSEPAQLAVGAATLHEAIRLLDGQNE